MHRVGSCLSTRRSPRCGPLNLLCCNAQYQSLGGAIFSNPSCASPNDFSGEIICAVRGGDNAVCGIRFDLFANTSAGYRYLGGRFVSNPSCVSPNDGSGHIICAAVGTDNAHYGIRFEPHSGFETGYQYLPGSSSAIPAAHSERQIGTGDLRNSRNRQRAVWHLI